MKRRLQAAAVDRFYSQGYARTTVDDIVAEAGVSKGAFYHHFRSKDEVFAQIQMELINELIAHFEDIVRSNDTASARLEAIVDTMVHTTVDDRAIVTVWSREGEDLASELRASILVLRDRLGAILVNTIAEGMASGEFKRCGEPRVLAFGVVGMCTWVQKWFHVEGTLSVDELAEQYSQLVLNGLRAD